MIAQETSVATGNTYVKSLIELSLKTLPAMLVPGHNLFCQSLSREDLRPTLGDRSPRYTIMTLLGLARARAAGYDFDGDLDAIYRALWLSIDRLKTGDLGLLLWLDGRLGAGRGDDIFGRLAQRLGAADLDGLVTMEVAWLVTGLTHYASNDSRAAALAIRMTHYLMNNRSAPSGLIYHTGRGLRRRFPNFATQIYSLHALSTRALLTGERAAGERAVRLAECLRLLQRDNGGWPWIYDAARGLVVEPFDVYGVHQDGMAPMALFALAEATGYDVTGMVRRGLYWLDGNNELGLDMVDPRTGLIYRSIRRKSPRMGLLKRTALAALGLPVPEATQPGELELNPTCRPYHLGWLLEAWCGNEDKI